MSPGWGLNPGSWAHHTLQHMAPECIDHWAIWAGILHIHAIINLFTDFCKCSRKLSLYNCMSQSSNGDCMMSRGLKVTKFTDNDNNDKNNCFTAITQINLHEPASKLKKWRILLEQSFTVYMSFIAGSNELPTWTRENTLEWCYPQSLYCLFTDCIFHKTKVVSCHKAAESVHQ